MHRFTISLEDDLARQFDELIVDKGYGNRSEAVRDLIRSRLGSAVLAKTTRGKAAAWCVATVSYVYDHHEQTVTSRVLDFQHDHHDLVISTLHTHLDHDHCLETVVLRGALAPVRTCAEELIALRGVRHGNMHLVPLTGDARHSHGARASHTHLKPVN
ncbi:MAG: nickel-responsive transcriptional regulator NikR [Variovorax sp.]